MNRCRRQWGRFIASLCLGLSVAGAQEKVIRLRNELIKTSPPAPAGAVEPAQAAASVPVSGLFLIQFNSPLQPVWREELKKVRVDLLRFVPEDAFVARFEAVELSQVKILPFIRWIGPYRAIHKIDHRLRLDPANAFPANEPVRVHFLLSPSATPQEVLAARRIVQAVERESTTRLGPVFQAAIAPRQIAALAESAAVLWIEPAPKMRLNDEIASKIVGGEDGLSGTPTVVQQLGYDGSGVTVAVADSGLNNGDAETMHPDLAGRVEAFFYYGSLTDAADEHSHGTHVTGIIAGNATVGETDEYGYRYGLGVAPGAHIVAQRLFDGAGGYEPPPTFETMTRDALSAGAVIGSNSWGDDTQGRYDLSAAEFDALVRDADAFTPGDQPYILEFSAGNAGPGAQTIGSPAVAKNVIATGACQNERPDFFIYGDGRETMADFSSRGPCEDGRIKPDVVAPGTWIASLQSESATDEYAWAAISPYYQYQGGTSQAGPHVSGAAAVFVQYYRQTVTNHPPSPALVKAALINSAVDMDNTIETGPAPNHDEGWGRVDLSQIIGASRRYEYLDQIHPLASGQVFEHRVLVGSRIEPLKITLVYTDVPGFPAAIPALVNDLDLEVVAPDGKVYRGNQFEEGESLPNAPGTDNLNNVEAVHLAAPLAGEYLVRVRARNVVEDARLDTVAVDQDFALVLSADLPEPGAGILFFDRTAYSSPSSIKLKLIDFDLAGQSAVTVWISSSTDTNGESIVLHPAGSSGAFTGVMATATGPPLADGRLQIGHNDVITATYQDASPAAMVRATARADLLPPVITEVGVTNRYGRTYVVWTTDEEAYAWVGFGTNSALGQGATDIHLTRFHSVALTNVMAGQTYFFIVASTDEAGNSATNDNQGARFTFVPVQPPPVLLVDAYVDLLFEVPPLSGYTAALAQSGYGYEVWDATGGDSPTLEDLRPYRVVIWRLPEFVGTFTPAEQRALTNYLDGGGSLLVASMEVLTRLEEAGAAPMQRKLFEARSYVTDAGAARLVGAGTDPIGRGINLTLDYTAYEDFWKELIGMPADVSDTLLPTTNAAPILYNETGAVIGLRAPKMGLVQSGRVVFLSFPLDAVPLASPAPNNRVTLLRNILNYLAPQPGTIALGLDSSEYTVPGVVTIELEAPSLAGQTQVVVTAHCATTADYIDVILPSTTRPGLFRGAFILVGATNAPGPDRVRVRDGDTITVLYYDGLNHSFVTVTAAIDLQAPVITQIAMEPDYEEAVATWDTSEPADALVQFGESVLLGRTAYATDLAVSHEVFLTGLDPDRLYYYQVVSRDAAGNTVVDDNGGQLYTFRTLRPLGVPFTDDFNSGSANWSVYSSEDTQARWTLGVPTNHSETAAHSPPDAWGSNLKGAPLDYAETFLISPAVDLRGGNQATVRFWHSYDFSEQSEYDILQVGQLVIVTNRASDPIVLAEFYDLSGGWIEETLDLTPYLGRVVYLAWFYQLLSFDTLPRAGWLVDDVSVTVANILVGTVQISNNLSQARFTLAGPRSQTGQGLSLIITNASPGQYVVTFVPVPFYQPPQSQTNILSQGGQIVFYGDYTLADTNHNGMADLWEQQYFGAGSPSQGGTGDSDGDGASDYAEFLAGTNPTNAASALGLALNVPLAGNYYLNVSAVAGRAYRLWSADPGAHWRLQTDWLRAAGATLTIPWAPGTNRGQLFRVEARP